MSVIPNLHGISTGKYIYGIMCVIQCETFKVKRFIPRSNLKKYYFLFNISASQFVIPCNSALFKS